MTLGIICVSSAVCRENILVWYIVVDIEFALKC